MFFFERGAYPKIPLLRITPRIRAKPTSTNLFIDFIDSIRGRMEDEESPIQTSILAILGLSNIHQSSY